MIQLIYISSAASWPTEQGLLDLLETARARNHDHNVTGMLVYDNAMFMQVLEGDEKDVREIYQLICNDPRHNGIVKLSEQPIQARDFSDWSMGFKRLSDCNPDDIPGFVDMFGGKLDKTTAENNKVSAVNLLLGFAGQPA